MRVYQSKIRDVDELRQFGTALNIHWPFTDVLDSKYAYVPEANIWTYVVN